MKKSDLKFGAVLVPLDLLMLVAAGITAYAVRFSDVYVRYVREATVIIQFPDYVRLVVLVSVGWLIVFAIAGLYNLSTYRSIWDEVGKVILACSTGILSVVIFIFLNRELFASRFIVLAVWILAIVFVSVARFIARSVQRHYLERGYGTHRVVIIGSNSTARQLVNLFLERPGMGFSVACRFGDFADDKVSLLKDIMKKDTIDEVILCDPTIKSDEKYRLLDVINEYHLDFRYAADILGWLSGKSNVNTLAGIPFVEVRKTPLEGWGRINKRVFDIIASVFGLFVLSPLFVIVAIAIKLESNGPVFYSNKRVGGKGKEFDLLKFRSMIENADKLKEKLLKQNERSEGPLFKMKNDPRVTKVGKFIRRWSIDELPQLWNVLAGDMSLVGPRPHEPHEVAQYQKHHKRLLDIKPGVTGMAQVSGRSDLTFEEEVRLDTYYIENWSLLLDLKILLQTPRAVLATRKAE